MDYGCDICNKAYGGKKKKDLTDHIIDICNMHVALLLVIMIIGFALFVGFLVEDLIVGHTSDKPAITLENP